MSLLKVEYCSWHKTVSAFIAALSGGLGIHDIEYPYRDAYDAGASPRVTAEKAIATIRSKKDE